VAAGALNTHHRYCDARMESLIYAAVAAEVPYDVLRKVVEAQSVAEALPTWGTTERPFCLWWRTASRRGSAGTRGGR